MKRVRVESKPTEYFLKEEFDALVDATYAYGNWLGGHDDEHCRDRIRALILLMRWSGLAIKDAVTIERTREMSLCKMALLDSLEVDGIISLECKKTK